MRFLLYKTLKDKRRLGKIAVFNCILYDASRRMANKLLFYSKCSPIHFVFLNCIVTIKFECQKIIIGLSSWKH